METGGFYPDSATASKFIGKLWGVHFCLLAVCFRVKRKETTRINTAKYG